MMKWMGTALAAALLVSGCAKVEGGFSRHTCKNSSQDRISSIASVS
ncbi:hypothetical protein CFBP7900_43880 [Xanthomonas hortorum pv. carotae]|uniref:Lipoprotein n=1 Tax=Xanthomonas hortorum pv. carotae TaxID=487904 RepID=A0A6V7FLP1_9XANT|nr:hypothetical protein CFBP7900_43880 [Xanthomonas hortorum pv. carotae]CAD0364723.1 hypothetical protein CFBP7900_43880 [Xanthomonas hortorum pv. carotae]